MSQYNFTSIGTISSCYKEKFGIPRQPGLVNNISTIEIDSAYSHDEAFRELETFSHIWVIFIFHGIDNKKWKPTVRPPRLGGNQRVGVFATRSMFRPNPVGLSVVELSGIERIGDKIVLTVIGGDFLDTTPVIDIKPYIPYVDSVDRSKAGYALEKPGIKFEVIFTVQARKEIKLAEKKYAGLGNIIIEILQLDPRPAYKQLATNTNSFAIKLYDYDMKWYVDEQKIIVTSLTLLD